MKKINLTFTGNQEITNNEYFKPFICSSDIEMPKMYNQGYNSYRFIGGEPDFIGQNMPEILRTETNNYKFFECQIKVYRNDKTSVSGYYTKSINKNTSEIIENFIFD